MNNDTNDTKQPLLTIFHSEGRRSERIVWACEELGLPYQLMFKPGEHSRDMIVKVNPLMPMVPTVIYRGQVLVESAAILQFLLLKHGEGKLAPSTDSPDYPVYLQWLHFAEGSAAPRFILEYMLNRIEGVELPLIAKFQLGRTQQVLGYLDEYLGRRRYFGGDVFSIADIMMHFPLQFLPLVAKVELAPHPNVHAWLQNVERRPAFKKMREVSLPHGHVRLPP